MTTKKTVPPDTKILYIEDNKDNLLVMQALLRQALKIELISAPSAEAGFEAIKNDPPDLILMDIRLPGMTGIDAIQRLQSDSATQNIPIVVVSADAMEHNIELAMQAGARDYLTKPFDFDELQATLTAILC